MSRLDQLPEITDSVLSGLHADDSLKYRIYQKAASAGPDADRKKTSRVPLAALCAISAVMIAVFVFLGRIMPLSGSSPSAQPALTAVQDAELSHMQTINAGGQIVKPSEDVSDPEETPSPEESENKSGGENSQPDEGVSP